MSRKEQQEELYRLLSPGETWGALKGWEGARSGAEYANLDGSRNLEVVQKGYTYIFKMNCIIRPEDLAAEEQRIREGLAAGALLIDNKVQLIAIKPRQEVMVK